MTDYRETKAVMKIRQIVEKMTLEEKAGMCSGGDFWHTQAVKRLDIPAVAVSDGPHGLRKQEKQASHMGLRKSVEAVCFPAACAAACSFDRELIKRMGMLLGNECRAEEVGILLGPAVNIKRSPVCGRNFEYFSEDPYVTGELAAAYIEGLQSQHVGASVKHFAANNQEYERMVGDSRVDERTLREIYLPGFEIPVKKAKPWTVMCSYNKLNGTYASENRNLLTGILRDEWGFEGFVMSDWAAVNDRIAGLTAGLELEMPGGNATNDQLIIKAVEDGLLEERILDRAVERLLGIVFACAENKTEEALFDREKDHREAEDIAAQCVVLLKNQSVLPLHKKETVLFVGGFAKKSRYQGGGSSHINAHKVPEIMELAGAYGNIRYTEGFCAHSDKWEQEKFDRAVEQSAQAEKVVIFAGLPDLYESESYDRKHMRLPACQERLIQEITKVNDHVIVVLQNGSPVEMDWAGGAEGIVEAYLGGEGIAKAVLDILYGIKNPCGKLAETFPVRFRDNPSYLQFPGRGKTVEYAEGIFVGYRYYDSVEREVLFPFGHGLSYTTFAYSGLRISKREFTEEEAVRVSVNITNTGSMTGKEVVQLYISDLTGSAVRPSKELKGFEKIELEPGETKTVTMELNKRSFAWYRTDIQDWYAAEGEYKILIGSSSQNICLEESVQLVKKIKEPVIYDKNTTVGELLENRAAGEYVRSQLKPYLTYFEDGDEDANRLVSSVLRGLPLRALRSFSGITNRQLDKVVEDLNKLASGHDLSHCSNAQRHQNLPDED